LSKALIGCGGAIATALITGMFLLLTNSGILQRAFTSPTPTPTITPVTSTVSNGIAVTPATSAATLMATSIPVSVTAIPVATNVSATVATTPMPDAGKIGPITFAAGVLGTDPLEANTRFIEGITKVYAIFSYENVRDGTPWRTEMWFNRKMFDQAAGLWRGQPTGTTYFWEPIPDGFPAGEWEFRMYLDDALAQSGAFVVTARRAGAPFFGPIQYAQSLQPNGQPLNPYAASQFIFTDQVKPLVAYFHAGNTVKGKAWEARLYRNGDLLPNGARSFVWDSDADPQRFYSVPLAVDAPLAEGSYILKLSMNGELLQLTSFFIVPAVAPTATASQVQTPEAAITETLVYTPAGAVYAPFVFAAGSIDTMTSIEAGATFPQSITQIVAIYQYTLAPGSPWRDEWYHDGTLYRKYGGTWNGKPEGYSNSWVWDKAGLPPGQWELRSYVADTLIQQGAFTITAHPPDAPGFGAIRFAEGIQAGQPVQVHAPRDSFSSETIQVVAFFDGSNLTPDTTWSAAWYYNGELLSTVNNKGHVAGENGAAYTSRLNGIQRLPGGSYLLKLSINGQVVQMATFMVEE
jgi:hypothetical protein